MDNNSAIEIIYHLEARKEMLDNRFRSAENSIIGRDNSFLPFITNRSGAISERKLNSFINELMNGLFKSGKAGVITRPRFIEMCECFLYCTIQGIGEYNERYRYAERGACFFSDIVDIAKHSNNLIFLHKDLLQKYEFETAGIDEADDYFDAKFENELQWGGFFRYCDAAYYILTGKSITYAFTNEDYDKLWNEREREYAEAYGFDSVEEFHKWQEEAQEAEKELDIPENPVDSEYKSFTEEEEYLSSTAALRKEKNEAFRKRVPCPEKFAEKYLRFRELFFEFDLYYQVKLFDYAELMVDFFLYNNDMSSLSEDECFAMLCYRTNKMYANVKNDRARSVSKA